MKTRGAIPVLVLWGIGLLAATQLIPNFRLPALFAKKPPMIELSKAEAILANAKTDADAAQAKLKAANATEQAKTVDQIRYSQQMIAGIPSALKRAPVSPEVTLASSLAERAGKGLSAAIGDLPADRQAEITAIVEGALSAKQAEIDAAKAQLAIRDHDLAVTTAAKISIEAQLPILAAQVKTAESKVESAQGVVTSKTAEVVAYATNLAAKEKEAGSLKAFGESILKLLALVAVIAVILLGGLAWLKFHTIGISGLASVVKDIKAGVDPIHAIDVVTSPRIQSKVSDIVSR